MKKIRLILAIIGLSIFWTAPGFSYGCHCKCFDKSKGQFTHEFELPALTFFDCAWWCIPYVPGDNNGTYSCCPGVACDKTMVNETLNSASPEEMKEVKKRYEQLPDK